MQNERRFFQRHPLQLQLEVRGYSQSGITFVEKAQLINISGGGVLFRSPLIDQYFKGQVVETNIILPELPAMKGKMQTRASVVRLTQDNSGQINVSVHFLDPFTFFRNKKLAPDNNQHAETPSK